MGQYIIPVNVINGNQTVTIPGVDATAFINTGHIFKTEVDNFLVEYTVAAPPVFGGTNTTLQLTANYAGATQNGIEGRFHSGWTAVFNFPLLSNGDKGQRGLWNRLVNTIESLFLKRMPSADLTTADAGKFPQVNDAGTAIEYAALDAAIGRIMNPLCHIPLNGPNDAIRLQGEFQFLRESNATYVDRYGVVKSAPFDSGTPTSTTTNYVNDTGKSWTAGQWVGAVIELKDAGSNVAYRWVDASSATVIYWSQPVAFTVASYKVSMPRFEAEGLLVEGGSTNVCLQSANFADGGWTKSGTTAVTDGTMGPDGVTQAYKLAEDASTGLHRLWRNDIAGSSLTDNAPYTESWFVKPGANIQWIWVRMVTKAGGARRAWFDLTNGVKGTVDPGATAEIKALKNGWFRVTVSVADVVTGTTSLNPILIGLAQNDGEESSYTGSASNYIYVTGAGLEKLPFASSYIPTTTASATRTAELASIQFSGNMPLTTADKSIVVEFNILGSHASQTNDIFRINSGANTYQWFRIGTDSKPNAVVGPRAVTGTQALAAGTNYVAGMTYSRDTGVLDAYIDGVSIGNSSGTGVVDGQVSVVLGSLGGSSEFLWGHIRNFRVYDETLTAAEMRLA